MKVIIQRVSEACVRIDENITGQIKNGILLLAGFEESDMPNDFEWMSRKIVNLRIFNDDQGVMNLSCIEKDYNILLISQFTLYANTRKGKRPSYKMASEPNLAKEQYHTFHKILENEINRKVPTGIFGADMKVSLTNDGPVTIIMDSKNKS